jgi:ubiquitin-like modifier-activating enzyme ATG7
MASATAVELMVSLIQHPQGYVSCARGFSVHSPCPRESQKGTDQRLALLGFLRLLIWQPGTPESSPLGLVPHQLRGFLAQFKTMLIEGPAYERCTGCSSTVSLFCRRGHDEDATYTRHTLAGHRYL